MVHVSDLAGCLLVICFIIITFTWSENYGDKETKKKISKSLRIIMPATNSNSKDRKNNSSSSNSGSNISSNRSLFVILSNGFHRYNNAIQLLFTGRNYRIISHCLILSTSLHCLLPK